MQQYPHLYNLVTSRYSCRDYSPAPVDRDLLIAALDVARLAPSAANRQPWLFLVADGSEPALCAAIRGAYHREWFDKAPVYIVIIGRHDEAWHRADGYDATETDTAIATEHLCLALSALGLASCWVGNFDTRALAAAIGLRETEEPVAILSVGYPADSSADHPKKRKSLDEVVRWGKL